MDNIASFYEYLNKDNRDFYKNLCSLIDEYIEIEQEEYEEEVNQILKVEFDKIMKKALNLNWINGKQEEKYISNINDIINDNKLDSTFKLYFTLIETCLTDIFKNKFLYVKKEIRNSIVDSMCDLDVSYTNYKKYGEIFLSKEVIESLKEIEDEHSLNAIFRYLITDLEFSKNNRDLINDSISYIGKIKKNKIYDGIIDEYTIDGIYNSINEQFEGLQLLCESYNKIIINEDQFKNSMNHLLKLKYLSEENKNDFINSIKTIDAKELGLIDKIDIISSIIETYYLVLSENNIYNIEGKRRK